VRLTERRRIRTAEMFISCSSGDSAFACITITRSRVRGVAKYFNVVRQRQKKLSEPSASLMDNGETRGDKINDRSANRPAKGSWEKRQTRRRKSGIPFAPGKPDNPCACEFRRPIRLQQSYAWRAMN